MTIILIGIIIGLLVLLALVTGLNLTNVRRCEKQYENSCFWYRKYMESEENYKALETGRDEESESYEQQYLSLMETIEAQATAIGSYIEDLGFLTAFSMRHVRNCLPDLATSQDEIDRVHGIRDQILLQEG